MMYALYFLGFVLSGILIVGFFSYLIESSRKRKSEDWQIGDVIYLDYAYLSTGMSKELKKHNMDYATLAGWNLKNIFYSVGNSIFCESWSSIDENKSQKWRDYYSSCQTIMGKNPNFTPEVSESSSKTNSGIIEGEPIETMTETMCQIYLKKAIEAENYELADKLRKRMENFR